MTTEIVVLRTALREAAVRPATSARAPEVPAHRVGQARVVLRGLDSEFTIPGFSDKRDHPDVHQERLFGDIFVEAPGDVARYRMAADAARRTALAAHESVTLIKGTRKAMR
ncbi:Scr1 family TA system antitoxin-like transcriptional regulator [Nonomuraea sp. NPDC049141]|uniref:Scr1 family TA system antitoxin-like transcriptional regulator n=1 Tax=Nonomuraea sp. NPDC049141 TaxID=3155500 RepID=UPI0033FAA671